MSRFRKRPVEIDAEHFDGSEASAKRLGLEAYDASHGGQARILTLEGTMTATAGDWIITGVKGERYPCKPDIFSATYEPVATASVGIEQEVDRGAGNYSHGTPGAVFDRDVRGARPGVRRQTREGAADVSDGGLGNDERRKVDLPAVHGLESDAPEGTVNRSSEAECDHSQWAPGLDGYIRCTSCSKRPIEFEAADQRTNDATVHVDRLGTRYDGVVLLQGLSAIKEHSHDEWSRDAAKIAIEGAHISGERRVDNPSVKACEVCDEEAAAVCKACQRQHIEEAIDHCSDDKGRVHCLGCVRSPEATKCAGAPCTDYPSPADVVEKCIAECDLEMVFRKSDQDVSRLRRRLVKLAQEYLKAGSRSDSPTSAPTTSVSDDQPCEPIGSCTEHRQGRLCARCEVASRPSDVTCAHPSAGIDDAERAALGPLPAGRTDGLYGPKAGCDNCHGTGEWHDIVFDETRRCPCVVGAAMKNEQRANDAPLAAMCPTPEPCRRDAVAREEAHDKTRTMLQKAQARIAELEQRVIVTEAKR